MFFEINLRFNSADRENSGDFLPVVSDSLRTEVIKIKILKRKKHNLPLQAALTLN